MLCGFMRQLSLFAATKDFVQPETYTYSYSAFPLFWDASERDMKILVAEDEHVIANSYKLLLESRNHEVIICSDGEQCLQTYDEHARRNKHSVRSRTKTGNKAAPPFDLLILDYRMPKKNGIEVAEQILAKVPEQRIVIASAYSHEISESKGFAQNVQMLHKPFEFDAFVSLVEQEPAGPVRTRYMKEPRSSGSVIGLQDANVPDSNFLNAGDIFDIFRLWR